MKLRIRGNSIRLRLTRGEVERLALEGQVEETVQLGRRFGYALIVAEKGSVAAEFDGDRILVTVPRPEISEWAATERVGIEAFTNGVTVLVEKDFACLASRSNEDESDMFKRPGSETR